MQRQACGNCMEGKSAPPVMIPMSRSSRDYRASKNLKVSSEDTSSASAASKKSQIRASGSPTRSTPATKKAKTGGSTLLGQNRLAPAIETSSGRIDSAHQPLRPASSRSKRAADANGDVTLETLRLSKKSKISISLTTGEASAEDNESLIRKNPKSEGVRKKQVSGTATQSRTSEAAASDNALKLAKSGAGSAGSTSYSEETNAAGGSVSQISEGAVNAAGSSEPPELTEQRSLRPRPKPPVLKKVVKRTRFHEVSLGDSDGPNIVGRRIKVFWPLDKKWYYGSVKAYNSTKKQHKIIYDDHDEEWLKLQKESFRLEVLPGDAFGYAAPSSDLADLADLAAIAECDESNKHRGDGVDGSTSASDDKQSADRTGVRRSKVGREGENAKKRKVEGVSEEGKKFDGPSEHRKKAGRGNEQKKKLEGDNEPKKKAEGGAERGKKTESARGLERKRGDVKQRATKGENLGRGKAKRAVLEVYERRKKRAQGAGTSGPSDRKGKGIVADGLSERRKRTGKESSRKGSTSQTRTRHSSSEATEGKKASRRGIRDNDRLFASIKSSAVIRRKVAESKRSKDRKPLECPSVQVISSSIEDDEAPEDEEKVFPHPQAAEAGPDLLTVTREETIAGATSTIDPLPLVRTSFEQECDIVGSPVTSTADAAEENDATCEEDDSPTSVPDTASDDQATSEGCTLSRDEALPSTESVPSVRILARDDATGAVCEEQTPGEMVVRQESTCTTEQGSSHFATESMSPAECVVRCLKEGAEGPTLQADDDAESPTSDAADLRFEFPPSILEESSNQEVLRSPFTPVTIPTSEMKHPPDKVYCRVRPKILKVYRRDTHQSSKVHKKGVVQEEGPQARAPVVEPVVQQLSASSCVISALHVILDGPLYFGMGLEGPRLLSSLRIFGLGRWSRWRDDTLQLGTYFGAPGLLSLLRVSRRLLFLFITSHGPLGFSGTLKQFIHSLILTTCTQTKTLVGFPVGAVENNSDSCRSDTCFGATIVHNLGAEVSHGLSITRPGGGSRRTGRPGPLRRRRLILSYNPYLIDPLIDSKRLSLGRRSLKERSGTVPSFERLLAQGLRIPYLKVEHSMGRVVAPLSTPVQLLPQFSPLFSSLRREIPPTGSWSRSSGAEVVALSQRWIFSPSQFEQIRSASFDSLSMRRGSVDNALLDAARRDRWMLKYAVPSLPGESAWHVPQGWGCREVGSYCGRRSLLSLLRVTIDDICTRCGFSYLWGYCVGKMAVFLMVLKAVYESCRQFGFDVPYVSGDDCEDLVRGLIRKLLADRAIAVHLARFWGVRVVADLRDLADYFEGLSGKNIRDIASRLGYHFCTRWPERGHCIVFDRYPAGLATDDLDDSDLDNSDRVSVSNNVICRCSEEVVLHESDSTIISVGESVPLTCAVDLHPLDARWRGGSIPRSLVSPQEISMCAFTLSEALRRPLLPPLTASSNRRPHLREVLALEGSTLPGGRGSTIQTVPAVFVVLNRASYAAAAPVLLLTSASRNLPEVYPRTSMRRCTDVGTYYGLPSIESFLRISTDFWRRVFQKRGDCEEVNNVCAPSADPIVVEEPMAGLFSQWPELSSVDTVDDEDLSDSEDRLQVTSDEGVRVGESFEGKESKKSYSGEDFESMKTCSDSLAPSIKGPRTGKGLKRGFANVNADSLYEANGAEAECPLGDDSLSGRPYSKRTRAEIESSGAAVITDSGVDTSSPSSDVDGNACPAPSSAAEQKADESALPRVNVLKLRRCPTNKGLWRVAGNSCAAPQERSMSGRAFEVRDSGEGAEPMTPVSYSSRKRVLDQCSESSLLGRNDQSGNSVLTSTFSSNLTVCSPSSLDQDMIGANANKAFSLNSKSKEVWFDCGMTFMNEVATDGLEPRKRRRKGPSPPIHGDDVEAVSEHSLRRSTDSGWVPCSANVLITRSDRCLRETGAIVELQSGHGNSWVLSVFLHGESKFAYKADQPVATGTSNKFTHAMMWRGGKDWSLEFVDRKQWQLFKDLHEECFQRSVRAATVRHIPIPGVKPIQESPKTGVRFVRPFSKYIHQSEGEVEAALMSSRVIYDMDSEDEEWLNQVNTEKVSSRGTRSRPRIEEDTLEKVMDKLEKISFVRPQQEPLLTGEVAAEICQALASQEAIRAIHGYWYDKRNRKGMALVRHFQPAPWEQYQRLLEVWQAKVNQLHEDSPTANKQQLQSMCKRPPLFAFCLRPRGLENRNKMQKQRSQRKHGLGGSSSRQWTLAGPASDFFLDSPSKRPAHYESSSGPFYGSRKYGRQRIPEDNYTESMAVDLSESFNALASGEGFTPTFAEQVIPIGVGVTFSHVESSPLARTERTTTTRPHNKKKAGRKARKMRLLASAEESRRKRQLRAQQGHVKERFLDMVHIPHSLSQFGQPSVDTPSTSTLSFPPTDSEDVDLEAVAIAKAAAAKLARETATAKRARAQALYAVADAAMHKAVAAVIAADAIHASERAMEKAAAMLGQDIESPEQTGEVPVKDEGSRTRLRTPVTEGGTSFGSWRRALNSASRNANHVLSKGTSSKQGLLPDTDDPLLPVASWSQELGAGLGTRLLQTGEVSPQRQRYSPVLEGLSKSPTRGVVSLGRTRGESMMAMLTR